MTHASSMPTGPVLVTVGYFAVYYALHMRVLLTKGRLKREYRARGEEFDRYSSKDRMLDGHRVSR